MKRTPFVLMTVVMVMAMILTACAPAPTPTPVPAPTKAPVVAAAPTAVPAPAAFDWQMRKGEKVRVAMVKQPGADFIASKIDDFKKLTGIDVTYEVLPEDQFRQKTTVEFTAGTSDVDVFLSMVQQEGIKYESAGWYEDIDKLAANVKITDPKFDIKDFTTSGLSIAKLPNGKLTGIDVTYEVLPEDQFRQKTTVEFTAGTSDVDVFLSMVQQEGIKYESAGWYEDIEKLAANAKITDPKFDIKDFTTSGLSIAKLPNGKLIGLPIYNEFGALMYNKALFDKAKIAYPPKTYAEMEAAAKALTDKAAGVYGFCGRGKGAAGTSQFSTVMFGYGSQWAVDGKANLLDPKWLDAMTYYGNLIKSYGPPGATAMTWNQCQDLLVQGKVAMWLDASIFFANVVDPKQSQIAETAAIAMGPAGPAGQVPYVGGWHLSIYSQSKHKEAAWLFVQWALGKEMVLQAQLTNITTGRTSAWNSAEYKAANKHQDLTDSFLAAMKAGNPNWNAPVLAVSEARDAVGVVLITAIEGGDIKAAATKANVKLQELLDATPKLK